MGNTGLFVYEGTLYDVVNPFMNLEDIQYKEHSYVGKRIEEALKEGDLRVHETKH